MITFYAFPIACALHQNAAVAQVGGDGQLLSIKSNSSRSSNPTPFIRTAPTSALEANWYDIISLLSNTQATMWFAGLLSVGQIQGINLTALEMGLSRATAVTYATLIDQWRTQYDAGDRSVSAQWEPQLVTLNGVMPRTFGAVSISTPYLVVGSFATTVTLVVFLFVLLRRRGELKEVELLQILQIMDRSRIPTAIGRSFTEDEEFSMHDARRHAERLIVE